MNIWWVACLHEQTWRLHFEMLMVGTKMVEPVFGGGNYGLLYSSCTLKHGSKVPPWGYKNKGLTSNTPEMRHGNVEVASGSTRNNFTEFESEIWSVKQKKDIRRRNLLCFLSNLICIFYKKTQWYYRNVVIKILFAYW